MPSLFCAAIRTTFLAGQCLLTSASLSFSGDVIGKSAGEFSRAYLDDNAKAEFIRQAGNLSGKTAETPKDQPSIVGAVEYDFSVEKGGWHALKVASGAGGHEFLFDGKALLYGGNSPTVGNIWLDAGAHTLRIQRNFWTGFGAITGWELIPAQTNEERFSIRSDSPWNVIRQGEKLPLTVTYGDLSDPVKLTLVVRRTDRKEEQPALIELTLPAGEGRHDLVKEVPATQEGMFEIAYKIGDREIPNAPTLRFGVVNVAKVPASDEELRKELVAEIDLATREPDYVKGGDTRVVTRPWGSYRESGDVGYLQHMNSQEPSWFAYKFQVEDPDALYWLEFDYPDDAKRTFLVIPRSGNAQLYAGPATGPDSGREFSLTNQMQTMGLFFWPKDTDLRVAVMQPQSGLRAAVSKVRVYKVTGGLSPLPAPTENGRDFLHWYEEGSSYLGFFGAGGKSLKDLFVATDNWAKIMANRGASLLMPTVNIYQPQMYPSDYNITFSDSNTFDSVRLIELLSEKYGLKFAGEFHPEGRQLETVSAREKSTDSIYQYSRYGKATDGGGRPKFNFLNPKVEEFVIGMIGEFGDRYGDSPAFAGASIRLMDWQNTGFGNFGSLDWGYGDFTIGLFEKDTGIKIPVDNTDPERFQKRYDWLMANAKDQWIQWRCDKATAFFVKVRDRLREKNKTAVLYLNNFLGPNEKTSDAWQENFKDFPREIGIDPVALGKLEGIEMISSLAGHGRRSREAVDQQNRDALVQPDLLHALAPKGGPARFLSGQAYFEATEAIAPPTDMGYPAGTPHGWVSGNVDPAGRHYLERYALQVAEADALMIGDGGNAYTVGQPLLREFLTEYRALPQILFQSRADAQDPVVVRELARAEDFLFYAVNRERYPVKVQVEFAAPTDVKRLATGESIPLSGKTLDITLLPYELRSFSASAGSKILKVTQSIPAADLERVTKMTAWLRQLANDVATGKSGAELTDEQKNRLTTAADEADLCLKEGRYWRARTLQETQRLRDIYERANSIPPLLDQNGALKIPDGAISGEALKAKLTSSQARLLPSEQVIADWIGQEVLVAASGPLTLSVDVPVGGKYQLKFGLVAGDDFGDSTVKVDGQEVGVLDSSNKGAHAALVSLPAPVTLSKGRHEVSLISNSGKKQGLLYFEIKPVYQDIVANRWMVSGPFIVAEKSGPEADLAITEAVKNRAFPPEEKRDFTALVETSDGPRKWKRAAGQKDFIDLTEVAGRGAGSLHYAVTYIVSPEAREVEISYSVDYFAKIWLNGEVLQNYFHPAGHPEKGQIKQIVKLNKGANELLLKVASGSNGNGFWFAINNPGDLRFAPMTGTEKTHEKK